MNTAGWLFILGAALLVRQIAVGRADRLAEDFRDGFTALVTFDNNAIAEVAKRRGDSGTPVKGEATSGDGAETVSRRGAQELLSKARELGSKAKGYSWAADGPNYYDCSGLVWRAMKSLGYYDGPRFNTASFRLVAPTFMASVTEPQAGDVVWWVGHMGIVSGEDRFYSALSQEKGIRDTSISGFGGSPIYFRMMGA